MDISLEDFFKNSFVLTIDEDRFNLFSQIFKKCNLTIPQKYEGFQFKKYTKTQYDSIDDNRIYHINEKIYDYQPSDKNYRSTYSQIVNVIKNINFKKDIIKNIVKKQFGI